MYYSLTFSDHNQEINTYKDWGLAPTERPSFSPPSFEQKTVSIPGRNGLLDLTTSLVKDSPRYGNRTGTLEFLIHPDSKMTWYETYSKVMNYLHGQYKKVSLEDDSEYWYFGRFWVDQFKTKEHYSTISIQYSLRPFKESKKTSLEWEEESKWFKDLSFSSSEEWTQIFNTANIPNAQDVLGAQLTIPNLYIRDLSTEAIDIWYENDELNTYYIGKLSNDILPHNLKEIKFTMHNSWNGVRIAVKGGSGKMSIEFNRRSL